MDFKKEHISGGFIFDRARQLCDDQDYEIRSIMASEVLMKIASKLSPGLVELILLENILHLVYDSEINVKCAGIKLFFDII